MKVLLVEDDEDIAVPFLKDGMEKMRPPVEVIVALSRDSALQLLQYDQYDLVICDLNIPTQDRVLDHSINHGIAIQTHIVEHMPCTPIIVITAYATHDYLEDLIQVGNQHDIFGNNQPVQMVQYLQKSKMDECLERVEVAGKNWTLL